MSGRVNEAGAGAVKGRTLEAVEADVERAVEELEGLRAESVSLAESVRVATAGQDAVRLEELDGRIQLLRAQTDAAQARLCRLHAERARAQLPEAEERAEAARAAYERAHAVYLEAHARVNRLGVESDNASMKASRLRQTAEENERRARELARRLPAGLVSRL
jgi:chromosome segregation ATPase